jgi:DNA-binding Lrp family transcriptional regulator
MDGRKSAAEIAKDIGLAKEEVDKNYRELKKAGIIKGATIHINYRGFGYKAVANLLINVDQTQADQLTEFVKKMEDIYALYSCGPKGNIRVVATLKTLQQLDAIKDAIKRHFSILVMKTVIWTDVREMHENLVITPQDKVGLREQLETRSKLQKTDGAQNEKIEIDEISFKIAEELSKNGLAPLSKIATEIGVSTSTVMQRYKKLKKNGLLKVTIQIDPTKIGYRALAVFFVTFTLQEDSSSTIEKISRIPDVISIMKTIGDYDLQVYAMIKDVDQILAIQDEFAKIPGIAKTDLDLMKMLNKWPTPRQYISTF